MKIRFDTYTDNTIPKICIDWIYNKNNLTQKFRYDTFEREMILTFKFIKVFQLNIGIGKCIPGYWRKLI